jgi:hypothetical protein
MVAYPGCEPQRLVETIRMQDIVEHGEIIQQRKILKHKADVGNAKGPRAASLS